MNDNIKKDDEKGKEYGILITLKIGSSLCIIDTYHHIRCHGDYTFVKR